MDGSHQRTTRLQSKRAAAEAAGEAEAAVGKPGPLPRHSRVNPPLPALEERMTRSRAARLAARSPATSNHRKRAAEEQQLPPGKKQAPWDQLAEDIIEAPAQYLHHLPEVIAGTISQPLDSPLQLTALTAVLSALKEHTEDVVHMLTEQQRQAPPKQQIVRHLLRVAQGVEGLIAQVAHGVLCTAVSLASRRNPAAAQVMLDGLLADEQAGAKHLLQSAIAPAKLELTGEVMMTAAMFAVANLAIAAWSSRPAETNAAAAAVVTKWYDFVITTQQALPDLLQALQHKYTGVGSCSALTAFANHLPQRMFRDICSLPKHQGLKLLFAPLHSSCDRSEGADCVEGLLSAVVKAGAQQPVQHQKATLQALLSVQGRPGVALLVSFAAEEYSNGLLLPHLKYVLQQLLASSNLQCQHYLARAIYECVTQTEQAGMQQEIRNGLGLLIQALSHCTGEAARSIAMALSHIVTGQQEVLMALTAHTEALIAAAQPGRSLSGAFIAVGCLAMSGQLAADTHQRQPLLKHVDELLLILRLHNYQYAWAGEVLEPHELPSPAAAAGLALGVLSRCQRGVAALLREQRISSLFTAVSQRPLGPGAAAAADVLVTLARNHAARDLLFASPLHVAILNGLQQPLWSLKQPGSLQRPEGMTVLKVVCCMTEAATFCGVVPGYLGDLATMMWQVPAMSQQVVQTICAMIRMGVGGLHVAPHARHIAFAVKLHAPDMERMLQCWLSGVASEVRQLRKQVPVLESKTQRVAVHLAQIHQQYRRRPRMRKLQLTVVVLLQRLSCMVQRLECMRQQLQEIEAADRVSQEEIEQQVRQAAEQQQQQEQ